MKTALVGLSNNILQNIDKIKLWSNSFKKSCDCSDVVLLVANSTQEEVDAIKDLGIIPISVVIEDTYYINHKRLEHTKNFIETSNYDLLIITDVFDVYFQSDPFQQLDIDIYDIFVSGEGVKVNQEPWNSHNIGTLFPEYINLCMDKEVICSGIIAGKKNALIKLYNQMFHLCEISNNSHNIKDQAALNVLIAQNQIDNLKIFNLDDAWAMHCAVSGPTQFFDSWGFSGNIKYRIPKMIDNAVYSGDGPKYDIVHQFNRIPSWNKIIYDNMRGG
jgi:hypothetical protein